MRPRGRDDARRAERSESGAIAIMTAFLLIAMMLTAAYVVDLGFMRYDRVNSKAVADHAAAGATAGFRPSEAGGPRAACLEARDVAAANLRIDLAASPVSGSSCETIFAVDAFCDPTVPRTAAYEAGGYLVEITIPVVDGSPLLEGLDHGDYDGVPCERVGVSVTNAPNAFFSGFTEGGGREVTLSSVGRSRLDGTAREFATLVVLQRNGCNTLDVSGQTIVNVENYEGFDDEGNPETAQGNITVDTAQQGCTGSGYVLNTQGNSSYITASGDIVAFNLTAAPTNRTYDPTKTGNDPSNQLSPIPRGGARITRAPVDHLLNCMSTYPTGQEWSPAFSGWGTPAQPILPCGEGPTAPEGTPPPPFIQNLHGALQGLRASNIPLPGTAPASPWADWAVFPRDVPGASCSGSAASGTYGPSATRPAEVSGRNWYIDCARSPANQVFTPQGMNFFGVRNVVSKNWIDMSGGGEMRIQGDATTGAILYLQAVDNGRNQNVSQNPGFVMTSDGQLRLEGVAVYSDWGPIDIVGNSSSTIVWEGPGVATRASCDGYTSGIPPAGCLSPLALWSNARFLHRLGGQTNLDIAGVFFTPNADTFNLSGQSDQLLDRAQFFSYKIELSGGSRIDMRPNPDTNIGIPLRGSSLIR
jgi:hypothetical protein